ncbi:MAG: hypothetical protein KGJ44_11455, partial [Betaproteobacteria bacterium]|nr:hypothetical protein [Betaproteobacteria bacterium]
MNERAVQLDQPLPDDVSIGSLIGLSNYRTYPVFSWPWWRGRTLFLGAFALLYFLVSWFGLTFARKEYTVELALAASAWSAGEYLLFIMLGPALATWVRTRGWPRRKEAVGIVLVIAAVTVVGSV